MADAYTGEVRAFAFNFFPVDWLLCNGQELPIRDIYMSLYAVIGTTYGGNGNSTFRVPNLMGRAPLDAGDTAHLQTMPSPIPIGTALGSKTCHLNSGQIPAHTHQVKAAVASDVNNYSGTPGPTVLLSRALRLDPTTPYKAWSGAATPDTTMHQATVTETGGNSDHENRQPGLTFCYCICYDGEFPSRP